MSDLSLSGLSSGLDTAAIIDQLMSIERRPVNMMLNNQAKAQKILDRYRALNTKLASLQTAAKALQGTGGSFTLSPFAARTATSSDLTKFSASADGQAVSGNYNVVVTALAREQKTGGNAFTGAQGGTLTLTDSLGASTNIAIGAGQTADEVATTINAANAGMTATVVSGKLVLTGKQTGETYTMSDDVGGALVTDLGLDATLQASQQASLTVDGVLVTSKTNTVSGAITGVSLTLVATGSATLTVGQDNAATVSKVKDLVAKYNDIIKQIKDDTKYDATTKSSGLLLGNSFVTGLQSQLNRMFSEVVDPNGTFKTANDVGLATQRDGTIALDEAKLTAALGSDAAGVFKLFNHEDNVTHLTGSTTVKENNVGSFSGTVGDGIATRLAGFVDSLIATASQYNEPDANGLASQGSLLTRIASQQTTIAGFGTRVEAYERRLELRERSLRTQFLAMEKSIAMLKSQGNYLQGQLAGMTAR